LVLDEPKESDQVFDIESLKIVVEKDLLEKTGPIKIDFVETGGQPSFSIQSNLKNECSGCC
jgi:Fe-S cluster assembly iron-binding protein IscA